MHLSALTAISPLDGRYSDKVNSLQYVGKFYKKLCLMRTIAFLIDVLIVYITHDMFRLALRLNLSHNLSKVNRSMKA